VDEMKRYCLVLELKEESADEYCDIHRNAWPELLDAIKENGAKELLLWNYKNFSIVYYECEDIDALYEKLNKLEVTKKWNAVMGPLFKESLPVDNEGKFITCEKIFDLNQQLAGKLEQF
jgi:L-rhamnose mutarotase